MGFFYENLLTLPTSDDFWGIISKWSILREAFDDFFGLHMGEVDAVISVTLESLYLIIFMPSQ